MVNLLANKFSDNFYFYSGDGETCLSAFSLEEDSECPVCQRTTLEVSLGKSESLGELVTIIKKALCVTHISLMSEKGIIYTDSPESMRLLYSERLNESLEFVICTSKSKIPRNVLTSTIFITSPQLPTCTFNLVLD